MPEDDHIPLHESMMALALKLTVKTQFGQYFEKDADISVFHQLYEKVNAVLSDLQ